MSGRWANAKPIDTIYHGYKFRSRLEARWAVFFDELGIGWEYEPEGFDLDGLWYLPDFWLPKQNIWIEIKGEEPTEEEQDKASRLANKTGNEVYMFVGQIKADGRNYAYVYGSERWDNFQMWCECKNCGHIGIEFEGRSNRLPCKECYNCRHARDRYIEVSNNYHFNGPKIESLTNDKEYDLEASLAIRLLRLTNSNEMLYKCKNCNNIIKEKDYILREECSNCKFILSEYSKLSCYYHDSFKNGCATNGTDKGSTFDSPRLVSAFTKACQMRFEKRN